MALSSISQRNKITKLAVGVGVVGDREGGLGKDRGFNKIWKKQVDITGGLHKIGVQDPSTNYE